MKIELKGHSGCTVEIVREGNSLYINKTTFDKKYIKRLNKQAQKQITALMFSHPSIKVPKILSLHSNENEYSMKMEYVYSKNFIDFSDMASPLQIRMLMKTLVEYIEKEISFSPLAKINSSLIKQKFADIKHNISQNPLLYEDEDIRLITEQSEVIFNKLPDSFELPVGICHGDLTFSNILFTDSDYYLIDFLDSFIETPLMDIVKIRQDTSFLWSTQLYEGEDVDLTRIMIISEIMDKDIDLYFREKYVWYAQFYDYFQLMNFLRILQYAKKQQIIKYLKEVLTKILSHEI